jgi:hypothetical protein
MAKRSGKRAELAAWLDRKQPAQIDEADFEELSRALAPISESYLRKLVRESGVPLAPMVEGVRQATLEDLESSLLALLREYETGDAPRRAAVRRLVIVAKDHARWAKKEEMLLWILTWLENPPIFPQWVKLRHRNLASSSAYSGLLGNSLASPCNNTLARLTSLSRSAATASSTRAYGSR